MFEKAAKSSFQLKDESLHPFILQASLTRTYGLILGKVKQTQYLNIIEDKDYWELFVEYENLEITYYLVDEKNGNTRVVMLVYTPHSRGKAKKILREYIQQYKNDFKAYLYKYSNDYTNGLNN